MSCKNVQENVKKCFTAMRELLKFNILLITLTRFRPVCTLSVLGSLESLRETGRDNLCYVTASLNIIASLDP